ncbi:hypothetical protein D3C72_2341060 [compost metagenome]
MCLGPVGAKQDGIQPPREALQVEAFATHVAQACLLHLGDQCPYRLQQLRGAGGQTDGTHVAMADIHE